ncbi:40S ribosomal protein S5-1 [Hordeum vulgare]|nr:40S ribosomal protein S5-1 [Hordeum vulgare]
MREGVLHLRDVEGPKKTGSMEARLEAMEQQVFKCQGMVEHGLNANHMMITEFTNKHKIDANDIGKHLSKLCGRIDHLQAQIYDLQNQNFSSVQGMEKNIHEILQSQKSLERVVETKFHDIDVKVTKLTTVVKQLQHEVDSMEIPL